MALTVEDGTGLEDADSYAAVADVDALVAARRPSAAWDALAEPEREVALRQATAYLDATYGSRWTGDRRSREQALDWPRLHVIVDGFAHPLDEVPRDVKTAACWLAVSAAEGDDLLADRENSAVLERERVRVGPIEIDEQFSHGDAAGVTYDAVDSLLRRWTTGAFFMERG